MARFGTRKFKKFRALTRIIPSRVGNRISIVTPGIKRVRRSTKSVLGQIK